MRVWTQRIKSYFWLTKPGIIAGNAVTAAGGYFLVAHGSDAGKQGALLLLGLSLIVASACVCNNYIDRFIDGKMMRTHRRALVTGEVTLRAALVLGMSLLLLGALCLLYFANLLALSTALLGFALYVFGYSYLKHTSTHSTLMGSVAGACPPVVGYVAAHPHFDGSACVLFLLTALWQMPHFYAIAIYRLQEYRQAGLPIFPLKRGLLATKRQMLYYTAVFMGVAPLLFVFGCAGFAYLFCSCFFGLLWLGLCLLGFVCKDERRWARHMFFFSLIVILGLSFTMVFNRVM